MTKQYKGLKEIVAKRDAEIIAEANKFISPLELFDSCISEDRGIATNNGSLSQVLFEQIAVSLGFRFLIISNKAGKPVYGWSRKY